MVPNYTEYQFGSVPYYVNNVTSISNYVGQTAYLQQHSASQCYILQDFDQQQQSPNQLEQPLTQTTYYHCPHTYYTASQPVIMPPYAVVPTLNPANMGSLQVEVPATSAPASMALPFQTYQHNGVTYFNQASPVQFVPVQPAPMQSVPCVPMQMHNGSPVPVTMEGPVATTASEPIAVPVMTASQTQPGHSPPSLSVSPVSMCSPAPSEHSGYQATPPYQHQHHHTPPAAVAPQVIYMAPAPTTMMVSPVPFSAAPSQMGGHAFGATPPPQQFSPMPTPGGSPRSLTPASQSHSGGEKGGERSLSTR